MLITSKFHDFYDSITAFGIDKTVVYRRITSEPIKFENVDLPHERTRQRTKNGKTYSLRLRLRIIGFCGKIYPVVELFENHYDGSKTATYCYSCEETITELGKRRVKPDSRYFSWSGTTLDSADGFKRCFDPETWKHLEGQFWKLSTPCFVIGRDLVEDCKFHDQLIVNPRLQNFRFQKVADPVSAFQSVYQYISGVLGVSTVPMVKVSDKQLAAKRGHDGKYSFRTAPGSGKGRRP